MFTFFLQIYLLVSRPGDSLHLEVSNHYRFKPLDGS